VTAVLCSLYAVDAVEAQDSRPLDADASHADASRARSTRTAIDWWMRRMRRAAEITCALARSDLLRVVNIKACVKIPGLVTTWYFHYAHNWNTTPIPGHGISIMRITGIPRCVPTAWQLHTVQRGHRSTRCHGFPLSQGP
jgi:hypothetical protein